MKGRPSVTLTASPNESTSGIIACHCNTRNDRVELAARRAQEDRVAECGPVTSSPTRGTPRRPAESPPTLRRRTVPPSARRAVRRPRRCAAARSPAPQLALGQTRHAHDALLLDEPDGLGHRDVRRDEDDAEVRRDEGHRTLWAARQVPEKLRVSGEAVAAAEANACYRGGRDGVHRAAPHTRRRLDDSPAARPGRARLDARGATLCPWMCRVLDDRRGRLGRERLAAPHDLVAARQAERPRGVLSSRASPR